jgi:hypothetical protein
MSIIAKGLLIGFEGPGTFSRRIPIFPSRYSNNGKKGNFKAGTDAAEILVKTTKNHSLTHKHRVYEHEFKELPVFF